MKAEKSIEEMPGIPTSKKRGGIKKPKKQKCVIFRSVVAAAALSIASESISNRKKIHLNEAQVAWLINKIMGLDYEGEDDEVISRIMIMEAEDEERANFQAPINIA